MLKAKDRGLSRIRKENKASLHKEVGLLVFLLLVGCETPQQKIERYDGYWGSKNELGETGWCFKNPVPEYDRYILDCENAGNRVVQDGQTDSQSCP